jgi:hypothetical protein
MDRHAAQVPAAMSATPERLVDYLIRPARTDVEKLRALYRWVTLHIDYDAGALFSGRVCRTALEGVWSSRVAVCDGFATLLHQFGTLAGLRMETVTGYVKGFGFQQGEPASGNVNHAWNAVSLKGNWHLLDATWDTGHLDRKTRRFVRAPGSHYFLAPPLRFAVDHFPQDPRWQLLSVPLTAEQFSQQVHIKPPFFRYGIELDSHRHAVITTAEDVHVRLHVPPAIGLTAELEQRGRKLDPALTCTQSGVGGAEVHALFPEAGVYTLHIFGRRESSAGPYDEVLQYTVRATRGSSRRFPGFAPGFFDLDIGLDSHPDGIIRAQGPLRVRLIAPQEVRFAATLYKKGKPVAGNCTLVQRDSDRKVEIHVMAPAAGEFDLLIFAGSNSASMRLPQVLSYRLIAESGAVTRSGLPECFADLEASGSTLLEPLQGTLRAGDVETFRLRSPQADKAAVIQDQDWIILRRSGDVFSGQAKLRPGPVILGIQLPDQTRFRTLAKYEARKSLIPKRNPPS